MPGCCWRGREVQVIQRRNGGWCHVCWVYPYLFADRTSCSKWLPNQFRLLISGLAYTLPNAIRRLGLTGTELAHARCDTIRLKLLKIGAAVVRNTRRVRLMLSDAYPYKDMFRLVAARLCPE